MKRGELGKDGEEVAGHMGESLVGLKVIIRCIKKEKAQEPLWYTGKLIALAPWNGPVSVRYPQSCATRLDSGCELSASEVWFGLDHRYPSKERNSSLGKCDWFLGDALRPKRMWKTFKKEKEARRPQLLKTNGAESSVFFIWERWERGKGTRETALVSISQVVSWIT